MRLKCAPSLRGGMIVARHSVAGISLVEDLRQEEKRNEQEVLASETRATLGTATSKRFRDG